jgi:putative ABC transport system substrate-binding protein
MRRREFIAVLGCAAALPFAANAQASRKVARVGVLWHAGSADEEKIYLDVLIKAFSDRGYVDGKNIEFLHRFPAEQPERFRALARELVESNPDVIIAVTEAGAAALKDLTRILPVVFVLVADAVAADLVVTLARPSSNFTGLSLLGLELSGKRLALLKEAVPTLSSIAFLFDAGQRRSVPLHESAAKALGLSFRSIEIASPEAIEPAFASLRREAQDGAVIQGGLLFDERARVGAAALAHKIPTISLIAEMVPYGVLMSYGQDLPEFFRKSVVYVDKILGGASPADLPVEQPTRLKMVINLKTASALGLTIPPMLLTNADEVIE